jgi:uncharacterized protein (DUF1501 family)
MHTKTDLSRRQFLRAASLLPVIGAGATPFALSLAAIGSAAAQTTPDDYKAIICLFLSGGNDQFNTVLATDSTSWGQYQRIRDTGTGNSIALPSVGAINGVLPIAPRTSQAGRNFALNPNLLALKNLFNNGRAAIIANVGTLIAPTTKLQYQARSIALPSKLFSHNDQSSLWQSAHAEGAGFGWGGRLSDMMASSNSNNTFASISAAGNAVFSSGRSINQFQVSGAGAVPVRNLSGSLFGSSASANPLQAIITNSRINLFEKEYAALTQRAINAQGILSSAMAPAGNGGVPNPSQYISRINNQLTTNPLAVQLQSVARIIAGRSALGTRRQVFFVDLAGFDTHGLQKTAHADLMARLAHAISYVDTTLANLQGADMREQVTLFTASDFGRTLTSNGDGTDHGWGSHHFIVGGAVNGGDIYGTFPVTGLGHDHDIGSGSLLPSLSVDQYGATLAKWFGLDNKQIQDVFPNIGNFGVQDLGFMNPGSQSS